MTQYQLLNEYKSEILSSQKPESLVEVSMLILAINAKNINRTKIYHLFLAIFKKNIKLLLTAKDDVIRERNCLILSLYIEDIFDYDEKNISEFIIGIEYLFECVFQYHVNQGLSYQAANAIRDLISVKKYRQIFIDILCSFYSILIESIKENENILLFDLILEIILFIDNEYFIVEICNEVVQRILKEYKTPTRKKDKNKSYNVYLNKCFNILKAVTQTKEICIKYEVNFIQTNIYYNNIIYYNIIITLF